MIRSLYTRILLWFWLANLGITCTILGITLMSGAQPLARRWMAVSLDLYAQTATDAYRQGGSPALNAYLDRIESSMAMRASLVSAEGVNLSSKQLPSGGLALVGETQFTGTPHFHYGAKWLGTSIVHTADGDYILLAQVDAVRRFSRQIGVRGLIFKAVAAMSAGCLLCWLLARNITAPLRTMQSAVRSLGAGDLSVRVASRIPARNDELADLAQEFDRMAGEIESLRNEQQRLLGDISHELRSPLTRLSLSTELASRGDVASLGRMRREITALDELIEQILTLTRLDMQRPTRAQANVPLDKLLAALVDDADFEARENGKGVTLEAAEACYLVCEPGLVRSCLENVIRNGVRFAPIATEVHVVLEKRQTGRQMIAVIKVSDSGRGVPDESLDQIFEPFFRVSNTENDDPGGSGLGLSISKRIVALYRGSIRAQNATSGGLVVAIEFPLAS